MAHRYWRLLMTRSTSGINGWITLAGIQMRGFGGTGNLCGQGSASASHNDADAVYLFDDDMQTWWSNDEPFGASWVAYDFGAGQAVAVDALWILPALFDQAPQELRCQWSDDGGVWHDQGAWSDLSDWVDLEWRVFTLPERTPRGTDHLQMWQSRLESGSRQPLHDGIATGRRAFWSLLRRVGVQLVQPRADGVTRMARLGQGFGLLSRDPTRSARNGWWRLLGDGVPRIPPWPEITLDGQKVVLESASLSWSPDQVAWRARLVPARDGGGIEPGLEQTVTLGWAGRSFRMLLLDKGRHLTESGRMERAWILLGVAARHGEPFAPPRAWSWEHPVTARTAVEEALGEAVIWGLPDWLLPAFRLRADQETPLGIAARIASAVGGVIRSRADGVLELAPRHPHPLPDWERTTPTHELDAGEDLLELREMGISGTRINRVTVRAEADELQKPGIWLEVDPLAIPAGGPEPDQTVRVLAMASPGVTLDGLSASSGDWMPGETVTRDRTELLRFENRRRAVLSRPASRIESVVWMGADLGALTLEPDGRTVTATETGVAVARVRVTLADARCHPLKVPARVAGADDFSMLLVARGVETLQPGHALVMTRAGGPPWREREIVSPLLTDIRARRVRAEAELDAGETLREIRLSLVHRPEILPGELIEVRDGWRGGGYRAVVRGVTHEVDGSGARTRLEVVGRAG